MKHFISQRLTLAAITLFACTGIAALSACKQQQIPLIEQKCGTCHSASVVYQTRRSEEGWRQVIHGMKMRGLVLTEEEQRQVLEILQREFSP